jgi:hypothetical protein
MERTEFWWRNLLENIQLEDQEGDNVEVVLRVTVCEDGR